MDRGVYEGPTRQPRIRNVRNMCKFSGFQTQALSQADIFFVLAKDFTSQLMLGEMASGGTLTRRISISRSKAPIRHNSSNPS